MTRWGRICGLGLMVWLVAGTALAEPYIGVRQGFKCSSCHTNRTGGGKRTDLVTTHAREILRYPTFLGSFSAPLDKFNPELNSYIGIGADLRFSELATFQDKPDANGRVKNNTAFRTRLESESLATTEAVGYLEVRLIPNRLTVYLDQRFAPNTDTREAWGMLHGLPGNGFIKAGRMFLPYGLPIQNDFAFIRGGRPTGSATTNFSFNTRQEAFEVGFEPGPFSAIMAVSDGPSGDRDVWVTGTVSALVTDLPVVRTVLIGASGARMGGTSENVEFGFFCGTNLGPLTALAEVDFLNTSTPTSHGHRGTFISYGELDYLLLGWLNVKGAIDYADNDGDLSVRGDTAENRVSVGLEVFLNRFIQTRLFYRVNNGPEAKPTHNQDQLLAELHVFF